MIRSQFFLSMKDYNMKTFGKDLMSGILVAIVALPLSIAFGIQSGLTLQQGIMTAIVAGFFISFLGGSKFQIGGPTVTFVALCFGYIANPEIGVLGMQVAVFFGGIILLLMALLRLGNVVKYIPACVIVGFTAANGLMLLVGQLKDFFGIDIPINTAAEVIPKLVALFRNIGTISPMTVIVGALALALIFVVPKISKKIPAVFASLIIVTIITLVLGAIDENAFGVATIGSKYGDVKASLDFPDFKNLKTLNYSLLIAPALIIAMLATMEGLLSATVADGLTGTKHNSNQELFGIGVANIACALVGGLPATGVLARTATNIDSGGKTPMVGIIHSLVLLIMYLVLMPLVKFIPLTALASILIAVSAKLINVKRLFAVIRFNAKDGFVMAVTFIVCVVVSLIAGVVLGIVLTVLFTIYSLVKKRLIMKTDIEKVFATSPIVADVVDTTADSSDGVVEMEDLEKSLAREIIMEISEEIIATDDIENDEDIILDEIILKENSLNNIQEKRAVKRKSREAARIRLKGNLNFITIVSLSKQIEKDLLERSVVIVDMSEVDGIDLSAVENLQGLIKNASKNKKRVIISKPNENVKHKLNKKH